MELDAIQVAVRPRNHWESIDLGFLMARRWWRPLALAWLITAVPVFVASLAVTGSPFAALILTWWFKPLYERLPLVVLSAAIFGGAPSLAGAVARSREQVLPGLGAALTYARLAPSRSFHAPVAALEGLPARARTARQRLLQRRAGSAAGWLTILGVHVEAFLATGLLALGVLLVPTGVEIDWWALLVEEASVAAQWATVFSTFVAMFVVAPFYVACGFSLYLNRRIELEGWDIEVGFRRLVARLPSAAGLLLVVGAVWAGDPARAEAADERAESRARIEAVLAGPEFHRRASYRVPKPLEDYFNGDRDPRTDVGAPTDLGWLQGLVRSLAAVAEFALWAAVIVAVLWVLYRLRVWDYVRAPRRVPETAPRTVLSLRVDAASLPPDVGGAARELWGAGRSREALALLYRAALAALIHRYECRFLESDTEGECLQKVAYVGDARVVDCFRRLTGLWQRLAYAHQIPSDATFVATLEDWEKAFAGARTTGRRESAS